MHSWSFIIYINVFAVAFGFTRTLKNPVSSRIQYKTSKLNLVPEIHETITHTTTYLDSLSTSGILNNHLLLAEEAVSAYSKVDKTGFIGFFATYIEVAIDFGRTLFQKLGVDNAYGYSIILFTVFIKAVTLPLTTQQLESTTKMQKLQPLQKEIQAKFANDEDTKNKLLSQLFQAAEVNPLAGCLPAFVQIPVFISLYRALTNLVAENKLAEPFLWIPDLEGPVYAKPPSEASKWISSVFSGEPILGWHDTLAFLSLPLILYVSQTISQKVLQPPKDPNKVLTEQEQFSQGLVNYLPIIVSFFSINVPAGLALYWVVNNLLTTLVTVAVKSQFKDEGFSAEVVSMMKSLDDKEAVKKLTAATPSMEELFGQQAETNRPKPVGFGESIIDAEVVEGEESEEGEEVAAATDMSAVSTEKGSEGEEGQSKRKKRTKPAAKKGKKRD